jgi:hypothetical protein
MSVSIVTLVKKHNLLIQRISDVQISVDALDVDAKVLRDNRYIQEVELMQLNSSLREIRCVLIDILCPTLKDADDLILLINTHYNCLYRKQVDELISRRLELTSH